MYITLHLLFFGSLISVVDIATHRIHHATMAIAIATLYPFLPLETAFESLAICVVAFPLYWIVRKRVGFGDYLLLFLVIPYARSQRTATIALILIFFGFFALSIFGVRKSSLLSRSRIAAAPALFLAAIMVSEII